jgi:hypothetical protein
VYQLARKRLIHNHAPKSRTSDSPKFLRKPAKIFSSSENKNVEAYVAPKTAKPFPVGLFASAICSTWKLAQIIAG